MQVITHDILTTGICWIFFDDQRSPVFQSDDTNVDPTTRSAHSDDAVGSHHNIVESFNIWPHSGIEASSTMNKAHNVSCTWQDPIIVAINPRVHLLFSFSPSTAAGHTYDK